MATKKKQIEKQLTAQIPAFVDKEELADFFKLSTRQIERWESEGCPVDKKGRKNVYDLYKVFQWRFSKIQEKSMTELDLERLRETRAKADIKEFEAEEKAGNLLPLDLIIPGWQAILTSIKTAFRGLVSEMKIQNPRTPQNDLDFLKRRIDDILKELTNENPIPKELYKTVGEYSQEFNPTTGSDS